MEAAACVSGNQLYVTGVGESCDETWKWESAFGWMRCADMITGWRQHCATFVNNTSMYVLGGFDDDDEVSLDSIELDNTLTNKWTKVGQLMLDACNAACAVYETFIYMFAGVWQNYGYLDFVQEFDTATKLCTVLTQHLPQPECLLRAVMWDKFVILINNFTCVVFDLEQQTFQEWNQFAIGNCHFGLVLENERIFIIGGSTEKTDTDGEDIWTCSDEVKSVAVMDIINNRTTPNWIHHSNLSAKAGISAYATMTLST